MSPLLILGASTRAAAFSAIRSGFDPICGDMFADADLRRWAAIVDVPRYPHGLADAVKHLEPMPFIFTGALENWPEEIEQLSQRHTLWGNGPASLKLCRDPLFCRHVLRQAGLPTLDLRSSTSPPPRDGNWMLKPLRSSAGRAVTVWDATTHSIHEPHYFQQRQVGTSISASFFAFSGHAELLGISRQLIGVSELHAPEFGYCGSVFPWDCDPATVGVIHGMGSVLVDKCDLHGLFGIDLIQDGQSVWLTEVNPRYTASMELIECCHQQASLQWHQKAGVTNTPEQTLRHPADYAAKVILYADRQANAPDLSHRIPLQIELETLPDLADIPVAATKILPGQPVFTCLGRGPSPDELVTELIAKAHDLWSQFT